MFFFDSNFLKHSVNFASNVSYLILLYICIPSIKNKSISSWCKGTTQPEPLIMKTITILRPATSSNLITFDFQSLISCIQDTADLTY